MAATTTTTTSTTAAATTATTSSSSPTLSSPSPSSMSDPDRFHIDGGVDHLKITAEEEFAIESFSTQVNRWRQLSGFPSISRTSAVKFLMARKFHVDRALVLYQQHELMRIREGLTDLDRNTLDSELRTGKFTILPGRDTHGATLALFHAHKHDPSTVTQKTTLQGVVYQLDVALEDVRTQRGGLVFIYNMSGSKYSNFDYELSHKMLTLLKGCYPARLKKVLIVMAPLWFKAPFKVLRLFVREKLRDRVFTVSIPQLVLHIPVESIPEEMGGRLTCDHQSWLKHCQNVTEARNSNEDNRGDRDGKYPTIEQLQTLPTKVMMNGTDINETKRNNGFCREEGNEDNKEDHHLRNNNVSTREEGGGVGNINTAMLSSTSSGLSEDDENVLSQLRDGESAEDDDDSGMDLLEFIKHVRVKGRRGLYDEYAEIQSRPPGGTFDTAKLLVNQAKNRYTDVLCYDHSRVKLIRDCDGSDYVNANFVDGYRQSRAFISTQGPLEHTFAAFWQMVWEQEVQVIVMTTKTIERDRIKCGRYWPLNVGDSVYIPDFENSLFEVTSLDVDHYDDFVLTYLQIRNTVVGTSRPVCHFQFMSWPDYGVPDSALSMLHFLQCVREKQAEMTADLGESWHGHPLGPPIVVHCSAGIGRTGTFATLDSAIRKFKDIGKVDIRTTVEQIRSQRALSIQMPDQYVFCHLAFLEYVLNMEYVEEIDLTGFDDDCESE